MNDDNQKAINKYVLNSTVAPVTFENEGYGINITISTRNDDNETVQELLVYNVFGKPIDFEDLIQLLTTLNSSTRKEVHHLQKALIDAEPMWKMLHAHRFTRAAHILTYFSTSISGALTYLISEVFKEAYNNE